MKVTLKLATSLDGRIATASGESKWITGPQAREQGHHLRAQHRMIAVGAETALADDPELTVRLPDYRGEQPIRVIFDSRQRLGVDSRLARTASAYPTVLLTVTAPRPDLAATGVRILQVTGEDGRPPIGPALAALRDVASEFRPQAPRDGLDPADRDGSVTDGASQSDLLVEGGGRLAASFLQADVVDRIEWFRAPIILGGDGRPCVGSLGSSILAAAPRFRRTHVEALGDDLWERYERA